MDLRRGLMPAVLACQGIAYQYMAYLKSPSMNMCRSICGYCPHSMACSSSWTAQPLMGLKYRRKPSYCGS